MTQFPPAWYPTDDGRLRWWDGAAWTDHFAPAVAETTPSDEVVEEAVSAVSEEVVDEFAAQQTATDDAAIVESWLQEPAPEAEVVADQAASEEVLFEASVEEVSFEQISASGDAPPSFIDNQTVNALGDEFHNAPPAAPATGFVGPPNSPFPGQQGFAQPQLPGAQQQFVNPQQFQNPNQQQPYIQPQQAPQQPQYFQQPRAGGYPHQAAANGAPAGYVNNYNATAPQQPTKKSSKTGLIIGLSIGGALVIALVLWLVFSLSATQNVSSSPLNAAEAFGTAMAEGDCAKLGEVSYVEFYETEISFVCDSSGNYLGQGVRMTDANYEVVSQTDDLAEVAWTMTISFSAEDFGDIFGDFDIDGLLDDTGLVDYLPEETVTNYITVEKIDGNWLVTGLTSY